MKLSWKLLLLYTFFVIIWGAFVRASGSGDGCGAHWPSCHGDMLIAKASETKTFIEYFHRATSGLYGIFVLLLVCITCFKKNISKEIKFFALGVLAFTILESLIGAKLVLSELVGKNTSFARAVVVMIHLSNTFFLILCNVGVLVGLDKKTKVLSFLKNKTVNRYFYVAFLLFFATGASGALAALGDSLYPSESLLEGFKMDIDPNSPLIIKLRGLHPFFAFALSFFVIWRIQIGKAFSLPVVVLAVSTLIVGLINLSLLAPVWLQLFHLFMALSFWSYYLLYLFNFEASQEINPTDTV